MAKWELRGCAPGEHLAGGLLKRAGIDRGRPTKIVQRRQVVEAGNHGVDNRHFRGL